MLIINIIRRATHFFWFRDTVNLFEKDLTKDFEIIEAKVPFELKKVTSKNIKDILTLKDKFYLKDLISLLEKGELGFYGYMKSLVIHWSWVALGEKKIPLIYDYCFRDINKEEAFIHYCETSKNVRGKEIYPSVLTKVFAELKNKMGIKKVYIAVEEKNFSSIKGILKAGFTKKEQIKILKILGLTFIKRKGNL